MPLPGSPLARSGHGVRSPRHQATEAERRIAAVRAGCTDASAGSDHKTGVGDEAALAALSVTTGALGRLLSVPELVRRAAGHHERKAGRPGEG